MVIEAFSGSVWATGQIKRTVYEVRSLAHALNQQEAEEGSTTAVSPEGWIRSEALSADLFWATRTNSIGFVTDCWAKPLVWLHPGKRHRFDVYSTGANLLDESGGGDDLTSWAGINEGHYYKKHWPAARRWVIGSFMAGVLTLAILYWRREPLWLAAFPWIIGTAYGVRNVNVFFKNSATDSASLGIALPVIATFLTPCVILSFLAKTLVKRQ